MRRTVTTGALASLVAGLLLGAGPAGLRPAVAAYTRAGAPALAAYFPMVPGTVWTFRTNTHGEIVMRVGSTSRVGAHECRIIETVIAGNTTQRECYRVAADGVYAHQRSYPAATIDLTPPQRMLAAPIAVGQAWRWNGRIDSQPIAMHFTWARREKTTVPAGNYEAMQLYLEGHLGGGVRIQSWRWFASTVGMVKEDSIVTQSSQTIRIYAELVSVTPGK